MVEITVEKPTKEKLEELGVFSWGTWEKNVSKFSWYYDEKEICYFLEGEVIVETDTGERIKISKGDLVKFPAGLGCVWDVKKPVKKHYNFVD